MTATDFLPRRAADYRTLLWTLVFVPGTAALHYTHPEWSLALLPLSLYLGVSCAVIAHNHMHAATLRGDLANRLFSNWISVFYGYPVFAWLPTHNLNHHRYVNKRGDATITWRHTNRHNALVAATYFFVSGFHQGRWIASFIRQARTKNPKIYKRIVTQYAITYSSHVALAATAVALHGVTVGLRTYLLGVGIPAFFALWTVMLFNYCQHVHTDPWSRWNHSRNFTGRLLNFLLFGNGYHTVHHDKATLHWSEARRAHEKIAHNIDPRLCHRSMWWFFFQQYVLALLWPRLGTEQVGRAPFDADPEQEPRDRPEDLDLGYGGSIAVTDVL